MIANDESFLGSPPTIICKFFTSQVAQLYPMFESCIIFAFCFPLDKSQLVSSSSVWNVWPFFKISSTIFLNWIWFSNISAFLIHFSIFQHCPNQRICLLLDLVIIRIALHSTLVMFTILRGNAQIFLFAWVTSHRCSWELLWFFVVLALLTLLI